MSQGAHAITVDVEEWFHICGVGGALDPANWNALPSRVFPTTVILLDILDRYGIRATFFVLGYVAERHPQLIERIRDAGHEIGSHGYAHNRVYDLTPAEFVRDLNHSSRAIQAAGADRPTMFRAPEWSINDRSLWALDELVKQGFTIDSSMAPLRVVGNPRYRQTIHRRATAFGHIVECPPSVMRRLGQNVPHGGGWGLRMRPAVSVARDLHARAEAGRPGVLWIHPWEIDDDPPRVALPTSRRFAHYFRLSGFRRRLEYVLRSGRCGLFGSLGELVRRAHP